MEAYIKRAFECIVPLRLTNDKNQGDRRRDSRHVSWIVIFIRKLSILLYREMKDTIIAFSPPKDP